MQNSQELPSVGAIFKYNSEANLHDLAEAERRYDALLDHRRHMSESSTVGALVLNGASIVAAFTALQAGPEAIVKLGVSSQTIAGVLAFYVLGAMQAGLAVWFETINTSEAASRQYARVSVLRRGASLLAAPATDQAVADLGTHLEELSKHPPEDFAYSKASVWFQAGAGLMWLAGTGVLLAHLLRAVVG